MIHKAIFSGELAVFLTEHFVSFILITVKVLCRFLCPRESCLSTEPMCLNIEQKHHEGFESVCGFAHFSLKHFIGGAARKGGPSDMYFSTSAPEAEQMPTKFLYRYPKKSSADLNKILNQKVLNLQSSLLSCIFPP